MINEKSSMIVRFRCKFGSGRAEIEPDEPLRILIDKVCARWPNIDRDSIEICDSSNHRDSKKWIDFAENSIGSLEKRLSDQIFLNVKEADTPNGVIHPSETERVSRNANLQDTGQNAAQKLVTAKSAHKQDTLDNFLEQQFGEIRRKLTPLCRHGEKGMCDYCRPLEPFAPEYLEEHKIKHESFYAHLRKINSQTNKPENESGFIPPLTQETFTVNRHCTNGHKQWPLGICSKCQPNAITLARQEFRMVDHVEFSNPSMVDNFLNYWRKTGRQRYAFMYGYYEPYDRVPLGIKAVVHALYEPEQRDEQDGLQLAQEIINESFPRTRHNSHREENGDEKAAPSSVFPISKVDEFAESLGLQRIGQIFTDLTDDGTGQRRVAFKRHFGTYFLTGLEVTLAAHYQNANPVYTQWSDTGKFGSRFVTCIVTGNSNNEISIDCYQISNAGASMVSADLLEPSLHPNFIHVKSASSERYVPDIFYTKINEYGKPVKQNAKPAFPVEYLLVTLTHGFPTTAVESSSADVMMTDPEIPSTSSGADMNSQPTALATSRANIHNSNGHSLKDDDSKSLISTKRFKPRRMDPFVSEFLIENRGDCGESQDISALQKLWKDNFDNPLIRDFHLLLFIHKLGVLTAEDEAVLARYIQGDPDVSWHHVQELVSFQTLLEISKVAY